MAKRPLPSPEVLRQLLRYEPETGRLFWKERDLSTFKLRDRGMTWNTKYAGKEAFTPSGSDGYKRGGIFKHKLLAHRVIWAMVHGEWPDVIDHINGDRADNRICNLRSTTQTANCRNMGISKRSVSGLVGVQEIKGRWRARIWADNRSKHLGMYDTPEEALTARRYAAAKIGFHRNHGSQRNTYP